MMDNSQPSPFWSPHVHADRRPFLLARARILAAWRAWFAVQQFVEVETAILQVSPGNEGISALLRRNFLGPDGRVQPLYLHSSPEFACKKLLAAGEERLFTFARVFRNRERGPLHAPEFTMLEWYRAHTGYHQLIADCAALVAEAARAAGGEPVPLERADLRSLCCTASHKRCGGVPALRQNPSRSDGCGRDRDSLARQALALGMRVTADDSWSDIFSKILSEKIEPNLGLGHMTVLDLYPLCEAALARPAANPLFAERFELYACGVELANAFGELTDPAEQKRRFDIEMAERERVYGERYPVDPDFLAALAHMPPACGIALGVERLVMLAAGAPDIDHVIWTPMPRNG